MARRSGQSVAIVGGGPGGASLAAYLAREGVDTTLFVRGKRPEIIVGESLIPAIVPFLRRLGVEKEVASYGRYKGGASFLFNEQGDNMTFKFHEVPSKVSYSYNVPRDRFDATILEAARRAGARVVAHSAVLTRDPGTERVRLDEAALAAAGLDAQPDHVVDAGGRSRQIARLMELPTIEGSRKDAALHAHMEGVSVLIEGNVHTDRLENGWGWRIPLRDRVSVGLVVNRKTLRKFGDTAEEQFDAYLKHDAAARQWSAGAKRITPVVRYTNYQLRATRGVGENWSLLGDAFGFVDPVFSSGLLITMQGAEALARAILKGTPRAFQRYEAYVLQNLSVWQEIADHYYDGRMLTMLRVGQYVRSTFLGRLMDPHFRRYMPRIFSGENVTHPYSRRLVLFMCRYGLAGNDPRELEVR
jgi:flavin-dependent dehydrogenase